MHSNVDPISRLRQRVPHVNSPLPPDHEYTSLKSSTETLSDFYRNISPYFEERLLQLVSKEATKSKIQEEEQELNGQIVKTIVPMITDQGEEEVVYTTARSNNIQIHIDNSEIQSIRNSYNNDVQFSKISMQLESEQHNNIPRERSVYPQYQLNEQGMIFFRDWNDNLRLCIGKNKAEEIISTAHDLLIEGAHAGYHHTYNRVAAHYYWPRMAKDIQGYVKSCDVCQKIKHQKHAPYGMLQPLPIPGEPYETITMDFITELPNSNGYDAILVIVDKLSKYGLFIPVHSTNTAVETGRMVFQHVITHYGIPRQIFSDRN